MPPETPVFERLAVLRAILASTIVDRLATTFAIGDVDAGESRFTITGGNGGIGRPLIAELLPLEQLMREAQEDSSESDSGTITQADELLDSLMAQLHDTVLNPALPFQVETPALLVDLEPINEIYEDVLKSAEVAGRVELGAEALAADALLFDNGEPTPVLALYTEYETRIRETTEKLMDVATSDVDRREQLESVLARLNAEWIGIGRKAQVEEAFKALQKDQAASSFEDERGSLVSTLESGRVFRRDAPGRTFFRSHLLPVAPLFDETLQAWTKVRLDHDELMASLSTNARSAFRLSAEQVDNTLSDIVELEFEYLVCEIRRDWLDVRFFSARYWRLDSSELLSDGKGRGRLGCIPQRIVFLRNVSFATEDVGVELQSPTPQTGKVTLPAIPPKRLQLFKARPKLPTAEDELVQVAKSRGLQSSARVIENESRALIVASLPVAAFSTVAGSAAPTKPRPTARSSGTRTSSAASRQPRPKLSGAHLLTAVVPNLVGRPRRRPSGETQAPTDVQLSGTISVGASEHTLLDRLSVSVVSQEPSVGQPIRVDLQRHRQKGKFKTTLRHRITVEGLSQPVKRYLVQLHRTDGEVIAEHVVDMASAKRRLSMKWRAVSQPSKFVIAEGTPVVHGYELKVVPRCPQPDESLPWN